MDARWFLKQRTNFIRYYYDECSARFKEIQEAIRDGVPFDAPPQDESDEPPFLDEWLTADSALDVTGLTCVSLLSDSLKLYFQTLQSKVIGFTIGGSEQEQKALWKQGFVAAYKELLGEILNTDWSASSVDFEIIEQVVLARNLAQHGSHLTSMRVPHDPHSLKKYPKPFFANEEEYRALTSETASHLFPPDVEITNLFRAIDEIEKLADWIDTQGRKILEWRTGTGKTHPSWLALSNPTVEFHRACRTVLPTATRSDSCRPRQSFACCEHLRNSAGQSRKSPAECH